MNERDVASDRSDWPVSAIEQVSKAVAVSVAIWMNAHKDELVEAIAARCAVTSTKKRRKQK